MLRPWWLSRIIWNWVICKLGILDKMLANRIEKYSHPKGPRAPFRVEFSTSSSRYPRGIQQGSVIILVTLWRQSPEKGEGKGGICLCLYKYRNFQGTCAFWKITPRVFCYPCPACWKPQIWPNVFNKQMRKWRYERWSWLASGHLLHHAKSPKLMI